MFLPFLLLADEAASLGPKMQEAARVEAPRIGKNPRLLENPEERK